MSRSFRICRIAIGIQLMVLGAVVPIHGKDVTLMWDANSEPDLAGYRLHYGTISQTYTTTLNVGNVTSYTVRGLGEGAYYFVATAYNQAGLVSDYSNEVYIGPLSIFYPRLTAVGGEPATFPEYTGVALVNLGQVKATLRLTAMDRSGGQPGGAGITNPAIVSLDPGEQVAFVDAQLFGSGLSAQSPVGSARIDSSSASIAGFFLMFDANRTLLDGGSTVSAPLTAAILPEVETAGFTTITAINPHTDSVTARIDLLGSDGNVRQSIQRTVQGNGALVADLATELFPSLTLSDSDYVRVSSNPGVIPSQLTGSSGRYIGYLAGMDSTAGATALYSPQYATGGQWRSTLSITNLDSFAGTVTFRLVGDDGIQIGNTRTEAIAAAGKLYLDDQTFFGQPPLVGGSTLTQGYVEVTSSGPRLNGSVKFGDSARSSFSTSLPLVSSLRNTLLFGHVASNDLWYTGLAIFNPNQGEAVATIDVLNPDGSPAMSRTEIIPTGRRISALLTQYFPALVGADRTSGYIRVSVDKPVAAFALFGTNNLSALSAIPPQDVAP